MAAPSPTVRERLAMLQASSGGTVVFGAKPAGIAVRGCWVDQRPRTCP